MPGPDSAAADPRGEMELALGDERVLLRPSFKSLAALRRATGLPLLALVRRFAGAEYDAEEIVAVVSACAVGRKPPDDLGDRIVAAGVMAVGEKIGQFLANACTGGQPGNARAETA